MYLDILVVELQEENKKVQKGTADIHNFIWIISYVQLI